jgi:hypothetical protein
LKHRNKVHLFWSGRKGVKREITADSKVFIFHAQFD